MIVSISDDDKSFNNNYPLSDDDRPRKRRRQFFDDRSGEEVEVDQRKNIEKDFEALIVQVGNKVIE